MKTWQNEKSTGQNNSLAHAFWNFVHFFSCPMQNHKAKSPITKSGGQKMETLWVNYVSFHLELSAAHIRYTEVKGWRIW